MPEHPLHCRRCGQPVYVYGRPIKRWNPDATIHLCADLADPVHMVSENEWHAARGLAPPKLEAKPIQQPQPVKVRPAVKTGIVAVP